MRRQPEPSLPVRVASSTTLCFTVPQSAESFELVVQARGDHNAASVTVRDPDGGVQARSHGELDAPETLAVRITRPGTWSVQVARDGDWPLRDVGLRFEHLPTMLSPSAAALLAPRSKKPGLIGYWPMDEGEGTTVADTSQEPACNGTMRDATWAEGKARRVRRVRRTKGPGPRPGRVLVSQPETIRPLGVGQAQGAAGYRETDTRSSTRAPRAPCNILVVDWLSTQPFADSGDGNQDHRWGASFHTGPLEWTLESLVSRGSRLSVRWPEVHRGTLPRRPDGWQVHQGRGIPLRRPRLENRHLRRPALDERLDRRSEAVATVH